MSGQLEHIVQTLAVELAAFRQIALRRLASQRAAIGVGAALTGFYVLVGQLKWTGAFVGLVALVIWACLRATSPQRASGRVDAEPNVDTPQDASIIDPSGGRAGVEPAVRDGAVWRTILEGLPEPAIVLDRKGMVLAVNASSHELAEAESGRHITQVIRAPELLAAIEAALASRQTQSCQTRMLVPVERIVQGLVVPIGADDSQPGRPALLVMLRDLTEQDQLARMRADFVANASHELRTPLASLKGFIETLQGPARNDPAARDRFLPIMLEQASRMSRLIEDLLSLSRVEMKKYIAPTGLLDLRELTGTALRDLEPSARAAGITLSVAPYDLTSNGVKPVVVGDRDELLQVASNLIQNAIKYGRRGGKIEIAIKQDGGRIALQVTDDGIGIAPEHLPRLTERFYRVSAKDSRDRGGTGLGLAIVKHIVNHHRGELRITSKLGEGSVFTVLLPRPPAHAQSVGAPRSL